MRPVRSGVERWTSTSAAPLVALVLYAFATRVRSSRAIERRPTQQAVGADVTKNETQTTPEGPTDLEARSWKGVAKRTFREFREDNLTDWAAALTYYGILAIFPALLALISILGLIGPSATQPLIDNLSAVAPGPAKQIVTSAITNLQKSSGAAGILFVVGLALALWSASGYVAAFMRASNAIYEVGEGRPIWKTVPTRVLTTLTLLVMLAIVAVGVTIT